MHCLPLAVLFFRSSPAAGLRSSFCSRLFHLPVHLIYIHRPFCRVTHQVTGKIISHRPEEIFRHITKTMTLSRSNLKIEPFIGANQGMGYTDGIGRMHIVINVASRKHQVSFQVFSQFGILLDGISEAGIALF